MLNGRRVTLRGLAFTVDSLHGRPERSGWSLRRVRAVRVVLHDLTGPDLAARELIVECDTLAVSSTVTATGITITVTLSPEALETHGDRHRPSPEVSVVDGEFRVRRRPGLEVVLRPEVAADYLRFVPVALITPVGRWSALSWLPAGTAPPPELPGGLRLTEITTTYDAVRVRATLERWSAPLHHRPRLRELFAIASDQEPGS
ncbi:hypothetical protein LQ327_09720 [Actinomycetospora endophytica]|uniref:Urease accessory protein n=1 Tax=Actinomycetospora endophytica TaxID=2291215 RepID=A0ABS8P6U3_9PSEU|nr:hypothetical protein [Actinomycetospora endophytica]MCD2193657.1 hypothetical protein [Actinomycetospora endophytica]